MPAAAVYKLSESLNSKDDVFKALGKALGDIELMAGRVLVWIHIRPNKTAGGIILTQNEVREDVWQGAVGCILKRGSLAFEDDPKSGAYFGGFSPKVGDWVTFVPGEGKRVQLNGIDCRIFEDVAIQMKISDPELVTHRKV